MRIPLLCLLAILTASGPGPARAAGEDLQSEDLPSEDLPALERAWHGCVRAAYAAQPGDRSRAGAQRDALDACRADEDRYVAAVMAAPAAGDRPLGARALAWAASVAASVVDPVATWIGRLRR